MEEKNVIRKNILKLRNDLCVEKAREKSEKIIKKLQKTQEYRLSQNIMVYMDFKNEVNTKEFIKSMFAEGKNVIIPYTDMENVVVIPIQIRDMDDLVLSKYGYLEPSKDMLKNPYNIEDIDLIIVPGVVFDKKRNRIGFGKGYYDKLLINRRKDVKAIALAYEFQILDTIPSEKHDIKMDKIITETNIY